MGGGGWADYVKQGFGLCRQCVFFSVVLRGEEGSVGRREEERWRQDAWPLFAAYQRSVFAPLIPRALTALASQRRRHGGLTHRQNSLADP